MTFPGNVLYYNQKKGKNKKPKEREDKTMTRQEIEKRLAENNKHQFMIQMVDRWSNKDKETISRLWKEEKELKELLKKLEK